LRSTSRSISASILASSSSISISRLGVMGIAGSLAVRGGRIELCPLIGSRNCPKGQLSYRAARSHKQLN
jgi:hypothetical protein